MCANTYYSTGNFLAVATFFRKLLKSEKNMKNKRKSSQKIEYVLLLIIPVLLKQALFGNFFVSAHTAIAQTMRFF